MAERRLSASRQETLKPAPHACEDEAREALLLAAKAVAEAAPGSAALSLRWNRSGAAGLLMSPGSGPLEGMDGIDWRVLEGEGGDGETARSAMAGQAAQGAAAEWRLHRDIYLRREDAGAIVRCRFVFSTALACLEAIRQRGLPILHPDVAAAGGDSIRCVKGDALGSVPAPEQVIAALDSSNACLLAKLGLLATGSTLAGALDLARQVESQAQVYWHVLQLRPELSQGTAS